MTEDYITYIRSKVGKEKVFLNFSAGILENEEGKVLLQLRGDNQTWGVIGGIMELNESSVDTLIREFREETGLEVRPQKLLNVYTNFETIFPNGDVAQTTGTLYLVEAKGPLAISNFKNAETLDLQFFSKEEIKELTIGNGQHRLMLDEYFANQFEMGH
ncbi:NUDIX domain-containing protein [Streptococcus iniae]|uniref:NUDIX hydrolase n=1 Tax=Streptococcus iniae TaxID=1346 RepID=UPI0008DA8421|nr:NUDIX domain-containing protein [Streptococcus iniae]OHX26554.1 DNA mismatch repair protein MutT [Streptococcus iniae]RLV27434.1 NUDIX domain-containing protein [Streptococcus iniae]